ncbi:hypothetical protein GWS85_10795 [Salmonella enterica]|nr:hypothetical protein [Salmonella enterica]
MDRVLHFVLALAVVAVLALLVSSDRKKIRIRYVIQLLVIEVLLAWFFLNSDVGLGFVKGFSEMLCLKNCSDLPTKGQTSSLAV